MYIYTHSLHYLYIHSLHTSVAHRSTIRMREDQSDDPARPNGKPFRKQFPSNKDRRKCVKTLKASKSNKQNIETPESVKNIERPSRNLPRSLDALATSAACVGASTPNLPTNIIPTNIA